MSKPFRFLRLSQSLVVLDFETTGVRPKKDCVVEVAAVNYLASGPRVRFHRRINPGILIPASATAVHGIRDEHVADSPPFAAIAKRLSDFLCDCDLAGFNFKKLRFLLAEFARAGVRICLARRAAIDVI